MEYGSAIWSASLKAIAKRKKNPLFAGDALKLEGEKLVADTDGFLERRSPEFLGALDRLADPVRNGGITKLTLSTPGMDPVVIDQAAAKRIHQRAQKARDPG